MLDDDEVAVVAGPAPRWRRGRRRWRRPGRRVLAEMSRPGCESGRPVNGSEREPKPDVSQPIAGQIDGVAWATSLRCSDVGAGDAQVPLERAERAAQQAEGVFGRARRRGHDGPRVGAGGRAALAPGCGPAPAASTGPCASPGRAGRRRSARRWRPAAAAICPVSSPVAARKLAFSCRSTPVAVAQVIQLGGRAPARTQADQDRQGEQADDRGQRRPQAQR